MGMNTTPQLWNKTTGKYDQRLAGTDDAAHVVIKGGIQVIPFDEIIYSGSGAGVKVISGGLENYQYWQFQVAGAAAAETVQIDISMDGYNFVTAPLINIVTGAVQANPVVASCMVRFGTQPTAVGALADNPFTLGIKAIKITRASAVATVVTIHGMGI